MKIVLLPAAALALAGCATVTPTNSGFLTSYEGLTPRTGDTRAEALEKRDEAALAGVRRVLIEPTRIAERAALPDSVDGAEALLVAREIDRQLCFALSERFEIVAEADPEAVRVRAAVTGIQATSGAASVASEEDSSSPQAATLSWSRGAGVAFDRGSLSDVGDAHRYADAFAEAAVRLLAPGEATRERTGEDPCARFGPRLDVGRQAARFALGLHTVGDAQTETPAESPPPAP